MHFMGNKNPKIAPFSWDFVTPLKEHLVTAIGNVHKNFIKIACVVRAICCGQTDKESQARTHTNYGVGVVKQVSFKSGVKERGSYG